MSKQPVPSTVLDVPTPPLIRYPALPRENPEIPEIPAQSPLPTSRARGTSQLPGGELEPGGQAVHSFMCTGRQAAQESQRPERAESREDDGLWMWVYLVSI
jgi:hypothetical protein